MGIVKSGSQIDFNAAGSYDEVTTLSDGTFALLRTTHNANPGAFQNSRFDVDIVGPNNALLTSLPIGTEFEGPARQNISYASIEALDGNRFAFTYDLSVQFTALPTHNSFVQVFDATGNALGPRLQLLSNSPSSPSYALQPHLDARPGGGFASLWGSKIGISTNSSLINSLVVQLFDGTGAAASTVQQIDAGTIDVTDDARGWDLAVAADGTMLATWAAFNSSGYQGVFARVIDPLGNPVGEPFKVNTTTPPSNATSVAALAGGGWAVVWDEGDLIRGQVVDASGNTVGTEFLVNNHPPTGSDVPDVIGTPNGGFVVTWEGPIGSTVGVYAQAFTASGALNGDDLLLSDPQKGAVLPSFTLTREGEPLLVWTEVSGIKAQQLLVDPIQGDSGDNTLNGTPAHDAILGLDGNDTLNGLASPDHLDGGNGNDTVNGGDGHDLLLGGAGNDHLFGDLGDDHLYGGAGADDLHGGPGNDLLNDGGPDGTPLAPNLQVLDGGDGIDTADFSSEAFAVLVDLTLGTQTVALSHSVQLTGIENLQGSKFGDSLLGDDGDNLFRGGFGDDGLTGRGGNDQLYGEAGNDQLFGGLGNDLLIGGDGNDRLEGDDGNDQLEGGAGNDQLYGQGGNDLLHAGDGNDVLVGLGGDDILFGGAGTDQLDGGDGNDQLYGDSGANEILHGGAGNDVLSGSGHLFGEDGSDTIYGSSIADALFGGAEADYIVANAGADYVEGGLGDDTIEGGADNDEVYGDAGNDVISGGAGFDRLYGQDGGDTIYGGGDGDQLYGGAGADYLVGDLPGEIGGDYIEGGDGDDTMDGGAGNDELYGNAGNDVLYGRAGTDILVGQAGADRFVFTSIADSRNAEGLDRVTDFNPDEGDVIDVSQIDADPNTPGDQAFSFVAALSGQPAQAILTYDAGTNRSALQLDVTADGVPDFVLTIDGQHDTLHGWIL